MLDITTVGKRHTMKILRTIKRKSLKLSKEIWERLNGIPVASGKGITRETIKKLINKNNPVILEIGCNNGSNTRWFLEDFENPKIHCFEPDPRAIKRFKDNIGDNNKTTLHKIALSDKNGTVQFHQSDGLPNDSLDLKEGWDLSGSILEPYKHKDIHPWCKFKSTIDVESMTLDTFMANVDIDIIDFVWMDVQGAEFRVLSGAQDTLSKIRYLYTEYSNIELYKGQKNLLALARLLKDFKIEHRFKGDILFSNKSLPLMPTSYVDRH